MLKISGLTIFVTLFLFPLELFSQGELEEQPRIMLRNEKTGYLFLNSNGMGAGYRLGKRIDARNQTLYDLEFMNVKDPKEIRLTSTNNSYSSRSFVFGKQNNFFEFKGTYGKQHEMFRKNDKGGISIRRFYAIGPIIGFLKPIYYQIYYYAPPTYPPDPNYNPYRTEKFNTSIHQTNINGRASFFKGFDELSVIPGATAKAGFSFEYSREDAIIHALEVGVGFDLFPKEIPIMATESNDFYFINLFAGYRFGKVIDISDAAIARKNKDISQEKKLSRKVIRDQKRKKDTLDNF